MSQMFPACEIARRQAKIDEGKKRIQAVVGFIVGLLEEVDVSSSFPRVGHAKFLDCSEGWVLDIEPGKLPNKGLYVRGVTYLMDDIPMVEYRPLRNQWRFEMEGVGRAAHNLQGFVDTMCLRVPYVEQKLGLLWKITA